MKPLYKMIYTGDTGDIAPTCSNKEEGVAKVLDHGQQTIPLMSCNTHSLNILGI